MKTIIYLFTLLSLFTQVVLATSKDNGTQVVSENKGQALAYAQRHHLTSKVLKQTRVVNVYLPPSYHISSKHVRYPVIYLLDGEFLFHPITGVVNHLSTSSLMPDSIVVGINNYAEAPQRTSDVLTEQRIDIVPELYDGAELTAWGKYQDEKHLSFLQDEVIAFIDKHYRTNQFRTLAGVSPTATFTLYTAWQNIELFDAYIAMNHWSLSLKDKQGQSIIENLTQAFATSKSKRKYLYLSQNDYLPEDTRATKSEYLALEKRLQTLDNIKLVFKAETIPGYAYNQALNGFISAMEMIYPRDLWEVKYRHFKSNKPGQSLANLKQYYAKLNATYGFDVLPKLRKWWATGDDLLALASRTKDRVATLEYALTLYNNSADAHALLADVLEKNNQLNSALPLREKAVELAKVNQNLRLPVYNNKLEQLKSKTAK